ncbi:nuclear mitotic apparatus protein 1 isoform X2 [Dunckerocampus dactyliophorus]|nr:nuclear mitotic apparatus protein 1 isoform X2 [Dunckerocampus dactyliophorus]
MSLNLGIKALLRWVNSINASHRDASIEELQDGEILLHVVFKLKKEPNPLFSTIEERFKVIAEFVEKDCRFSPTKGTSLSWDNIRNGSNLTVEIAKVLLLLVYQDMMNDRCTLDTLECDVERELANLTGSFVMESDGCVYLNSGLDGYLAKRLLPVSREIFEQAGSASISSTSTISSISDTDSPVFHRSQKITFVDVHTVASSSASKSPLQDIMNTPKFQLRKLKRQMFKERDYIDGLERELASKIALIAQRESHINQLQYCLDKLKNEQSDQEQVAREQIGELETKNSSLRMRLSEIIKQNKDWKSNSLLMERKVTELAEENGILSSKVRAASSQLTIFEAEVGRLTQSEASAQEEWRTRTDYLQSELKQATAEKELLNEQILILQGKISCLEDEIRKAANEVIGENLGPIMERDQLESDICRLKNELDSAFGCLKTAEANVEAKTQQLAEYEQKIAQQKELLEQQKSQIEAVVKLKERHAEKENLLLGAEEKLDLLQTELAAVKTQAAEKDHSLDTLRAEVSAQAHLLQKANEEAQSTANVLATIQEESSKQTHELQQEIQQRKGELEVISLKLKEREHQLFERQQESAQLIEQLQLQLVSVGADLKRHKEAQDETLKQREGDLELQVVLTREKEALAQEKEDLLAKVLQARNDQRALEKQVEVLVLEKERLVQTKQATDRENMASRKLEQILKQDLELLKVEKLKLVNELEKNEALKKDLQEQLAAKSEAVEHYKAQVRAASSQVTIFEAEVGRLTQSEASAQEEWRTRTDYLQSELKQATAEKELLNEQILILQGKISCLEDEIRKAANEVIGENLGPIMERDQLESDICRLKNELDSVFGCLKTAEANVEAKTQQLAEYEQKIAQQKELLEQQKSQIEAVVKLKERHDEKENLLLGAEEKLDLLQTELAAVKTQAAEKDHSLDTLRAEVSAQAHLLQKANEEAQSTANMLATIQEESSKQTHELQQEIQQRKGELEVISLKLKEREHQLFERQQESAQLIEQLQLQLVSVSADLKRHKEAQDETLKQREGDLELQVVLTREKEALAQEKEDLLAKVLQARNDQRALEKQVEVLVLEKERLVQTKQATDRENMASRKLEQILKQDLELLKVEKLKLVNELEKNEALKKDLQEQLAAKSEAVEHYKAQMEKAASHYNDKKQLLIASQEETSELKHSLEVRERELTATAMENKLLQLDLEKAKSQEKNMLNKLADLEAQLAFADQNLRAQNRISGQGGTSESCYLEVPTAHTNVQTKGTTSSDSLDQSSLEDSLNNTRTLSAPGESSTPLVRSSERLAAKRCGLQAESLESLYFTPINTRHVNRTSTEQKTGRDSVFKNPSSSVKRRRTTQVINITMTKKTSGDVEGEESFYSPTLARSQPNLSSAHAARPVSMELFDTPAKLSEAASDQLIGLPGYRRSTLHSQTTSTFCVGAENEPDGAPNDWMRIAELQARNKACLPHLKSSYPVEFEPCQKSAFIFSDEEVRNGDPLETIRRASVMPGQLQDSLASHRHSLMPGQSTTAAGTRSHRLSLIAGQPSSKSIRSSQPRSPKFTKRSASTLSVHQSSPEKKLKASCFPRPLTPKNKNINSGPSSARLHPALSPAERRQSTVFTINNTPKKNGSYLKNGLSKLRSSTRKSPGKASKRSPADALSKENMPAATSRAAAGRAGRCGSFNSPQVVSKETRKSPQTVSRSAKSPRLTASSRKMMMMMRKKM